MKKCNLFISNYTIGNSPSLLNLIELLSFRFVLHVFLEDVQIVPDTLLKSKNIRFTQIIRNLSLFRKIMIFLKRVSYYRIKSLFTGSAYVHFHFYPYRSSCKEINIAVDPHGFRLASHCLGHESVFYYSLELYLNEDHTGLDYPKELKKFERENINSIKGLIIQNKVKAKIFYNDYLLCEEKPCFYLPVTLSGEGQQNSANLFRDKFKLSDDVLICVHIGGIAKWHSIEEIIDQVKNNDRLFLYVQGYPDKSYLEHLLRKIEVEKINNVYISTEIFDDIKDVDKILEASDVGIAWYNPISTGFKVAAGSSGKIVSYLKHGLPVLINRTDSSIEYIDQRGVGLSCESYDEIFTKLKEINLKYDEFSNNAFNEYKKVYKFENYKESLIEFLENL